MRSSKSPADKILRNNRVGWGKRKAYSVSVDEAETLISAGAKIKSVDAPANGTYNYFLKFKKQLFICSSSHKI